MNEQFSAFLDGEATRDEADSVINSLLRDESLRDSWSRQHRIREVLRSARGESDVALDMAFSERVMQAVRAPQQPAFRPLASSDRAAAAAMPRPRQRRRRRIRGMAGFAVAASTVGFALLVAQPTLTGPGQGPAPGTVETLASQPGAADGIGATDATRVALAGSSDKPRLQLAESLSGDLFNNRDIYGKASQEAVDHWEVSNPVLANRLNDYLVEHTGLARAYGLGATTPGFIRVATYGPGGLR